MLVFLCFPASRLLCCITCCDYKATLKPTAVLSWALHVWCANNDRRNIYGLIMLVLEICVSKLKKVLRFVQFMYEKAVKNTKF